MSRFDGGKAERREQAPPLRSVLHRTGNVSGEFYWRVEDPDVRLAVFREVDHGIEPLERTWDFEVECTALHSVI